MCKSKLVTADATLIFNRKMDIEAMMLTAAAATSTLELFDGAIGTIATKAIGAAGSGYTVGDTITVAAAGGGTQAVFTVATVGGSGDVTGLTLVSGGSGYTAGSTYATTGGTGTGLTVTASTVTDSGTSIGKLSCVANTSDQFVFDDLSVDSGISARITGSGAKGYFLYD